MPFSSSSTNGTRVAFEEVETTKAIVELEGASPAGLQVYVMRGGSELQYKPKRRSAMVQALPGGVWRSEGWRSRTITSTKYRAQSPGWA